MKLDTKVDLKQIILFLWTKFPPKSVEKPQDVKFYVNWITKYWCFLLEFSEREKNQDGVCISLSIMEKEFGG